VNGVDANCEWMKGEVEIEVHASETFGAIPPLRDPTIPQEAGLKSKSVGSLRSE
jgi:hypothetical protein